MCVYVSFRWVHIILVQPVSSLQAISVILSQRSSDPVEHSVSSLEEPVAADGLPYLKFFTALV